MHNGDIHWTLVLCRTQGPVNLGMIMRLCGNLGIADLRLVDVQCDPNDDDARRFANHHRDRLAQVPHYEDLGAAIADCDCAIATTARVRDERYGQALALGDMVSVIAERRARRVALVFGNEAHGLTNDELARCALHLHLDTPGDYPSYNLAHAVAIVAHYCTVLMRPLPPSVSGAAPAANDALVHRLGSYWLDSLQRFQYFRGNRQREPFAREFRQLLHRLALSHDDATVLFACLAQFNYHAFGDKGLVADMQDTASEDTAAPPS